MDRTYEPPAALPVSTKRWPTKWSDEIINVVTTNGGVHFELLSLNSQAKKIQIYNLRGKLQTSLNLDNHGKTVWNTHSISPGVYFAQTITSNEKTHIKFVVD